MYKLMYIYVYIDIKKLLVLMTIAELIINIIELYI